MERHEPHGPDAARRSRAARTRPVTGRRVWISLLVLVALAASCAVVVRAFSSSEEPRDARSAGAATEGRHEEPDGRAGHPSGRLVATGRKDPPPMNAMTMCMGRQGWPVVPYEGTRRGYVPDRPIPPEGQLGFLKAERYCSERTGREETQEHPGPAELESLYADVISTKRCLEDQGYLVVETPSLDEFVQVRGAWDPFASLVSPDLGYIGDGEYLRLNDLCPNPLPR